MSPPRASNATSTSIASLPKTTAAFVEPMRAKLVSTLPEGDDWLYEVKFDGYRALAIKRRAGIELRSRNDTLLTSRFPRIARAGCAGDRHRAGRRDFGFGRSRTTRLQSVAEGNAHDAGCVLRVRHHDVPRSPSPRTTSR